MWRSVRRTRLSLLSAFFCLGSVGLAQAAPQQNAPGVTDLIRDRQNRLLEEQQRRLEELKALPGKEAIPPATSTPADSRASGRCLIAWRRDVC